MFYTEIKTTDSESSAVHCQLGYTLKNILHMQWVRGRGWSHKWSCTVVVL